MLCGGEIIRIEEAGKVFYDYLLDWLRKIFAALQYPESKLVYKRTESFSGKSILSFDMVFHGRFSSGDLLMKISKIRC